MATVIKIFDGNRGKRGLQEGEQRWLEFERVAQVTGVTGADSEAKLAAAVAACPALGSTLTAFPGLTLREIEPSLETDSVARCRLLYRYEKPTDDQQNPPNKCQIRVGASTTSEETNKDNTGTAMEVSYSYAGKREQKDWPNPKEDPQKQSGVVQFLVPAPVMALTRTEAASPWANAVMYVGRVNSAAIWGCAARTLRCDSIEGTSEDGGNVYTVSYQFSYNPNTWDFTVRYIDPATGKNPTDLDANSQKVFKVYPEQAFVNLGLTF